MSFARVFPYFVPNRFCFRNIVLILGPSFTPKTCLLKQLLALLLFLFSLSFSAFSQLMVKARAGLNVSRLQREYASFRSTEDKQVFKLGPNAGVALEIPLEKGFSLQAELNYSLKGMKDRSEIIRNNGTYYGYGFNFHYAELPLLLRYAVTEKFRAGIGASLAWLLKAEESIEGIDVTDAAHEYKKMDVGLNGDVSYLFNRLEVGARYNHGLLMVKFKGNRDPELTGPEDQYHKVGRNRTLQVYVAYRLKR